MEEFVTNGTKAKIHFLDEYITKAGKILDLQPSDLIFKEAQATLRSSDGKEVLKWI